MIVNDQFLLVLYCSTIICCHHTQIILMSACVEGQSCVSTMCEGHDQEDHWICCCSGEGAVPQLDILLQSANSVTTLLGARSHWSATLPDVPMAGSDTTIYMHAGLVALIVIILLLMAGVPKCSIVLEKKGLRPGNRTRPGDIVALNFYGLLGRHLVIDVVLCTVYRNVTLAQTCSIPGYAAKMYYGRGSEVLQRQEVFTSGVQQVWGNHVFVPFAMEDGGTLGAHALALLKQLAEFAVSRGCFCSPDSRAPLTAPMQVSLWMQRWQHRLSTWLHVTLSQQLLRMHHAPA